MAQIELVRVKMVRVLVSEKHHICRNERMRVGIVSSEIQRASPSDVGAHGVVNRAPSGWSGDSTAVMEGKLSCILQCFSIEEDNYSWME